MNKLVEFVPKSSQNMRHKPQWTQNTISSCFTYASNSAVTIQIATQKLLLMVRHTTDQVIMQHSVVHLQNTGICIHTKLLNTSSSPDLHPSQQIGKLTHDYIANIFRRESISLPSLQYELNFQRPCSSSSCTFYKVTLTIQTSNIEKWIRLRPY